MRVRAFAEQEAAELDIFPKWAGFKIPYFDLDGALRPDGFYRFRFVTDRPSSGWRSLGAPEKPRRYAQPPSSGVAAYLPPTIIGHTWREVASDPAIPVTITEGELKSACASSLGPPTVGLGGVNNWRVAGAPRDQLLPELEEFRWDGRTVIILFDSNIERNPNVICAASMLASVLTMRGAVVKLTHPPAPPDEADKHGTGIDDWLYALPPSIDKAEALTNLLAAAPDVEGNKALHAVNLELARVVASKDYVRLADGRRIAKRELIEETEYGGRTYTIEILSGDQAVKKTVNTIKTWLVWRHARELKSYDYAPGCPQITAQNTYNLWPGWGVEPAAGDVAPFLKMINDYLMRTAAPLERQWFMCWLAAPLQQPGLKMMSGALFWSPHHGVGKTLVGETMSRIYGRNFGIIESKNLHSNFNSYVVRKQFIQGDENSTSDKRTIGERLKNIISSKTVVVEEKYQIPYPIPDRANYFFTSNYPDAFILDEDDRRFFVHEVEAPPLTQEAYTAYYRWLDHEGGAAALFAYLLALPLGDFDPYARPPMTAAKADMISLGYSDLRRWVEDVKRDPEAVLGRPGHLTTVARLVTAYKRDAGDRANVDAAWMGKELAKAGVRKAAGGSPNIRVDGRMTRVHIVGAPPDEEARLRRARALDVQALMDETEAESPRAKFEAARGVKSGRVQ